MIRRKQWYQRRVLFFFFFFFFFALEKVLFERHVIVHFFFPVVFPFSLFFFDFLFFFHIFFFFLCFLVLFSLWFCLFRNPTPTEQGSVVEDAMVTILNGNGGNNEGLAKIWEEPQPDWSVYRESNWGFGVSTIYNSTHLHWQMIRADNHSVADDWWFVRQH
eukprot:TRINITY_DN4919_c0_g1_i11.p1 TRINITY_DN4919_c0_g1~~TRINITY_DN4919_c0_g1_i11.p1  ORF type:complete len:161 (-),score=33.91 TRINITY_DN4919_c0_g1_i11:206-688(-)